MKIWHERFCHINNEYLVKTSKNNCVRGLPSLTDDRSHCIPCKLAKSRRVSFKETGAVRSKRPLELLHMDLCGPMPALSQGGNKYFFTIIDDYSRKVTVFPINKMSDVFQTFLRFQRRAERFLGRKILSVKTDGGLEFCNKDLDNFLEQQGINHEKTNPYTPEQNGVAERYNLTALDGVKTLLKSSGVAQKFWGEALLCFTYTWNRVCHKDGNKTPFEKYSGKKPSVSHIKPFGCLAYVCVPKQIRKKLDMRAKLGIMMGYALHTKGYRIWLRDENKLIETINVRFDENTKGVDASQNSNQYTKFNFTISNYSDDEGDFDTVMDSLSGRLIPETSSESPSTSREEPSASTDSSLIPCSEIKWIRKIGREVTGAGIYYGIEGKATRLKSFKEIERYCREHKINFDKNLFDFRGENTKSEKLTDSDEGQQEANVVEVKIPTCYQQAIRSRESSEWCDAMDREINVMIECKVWDLVDPPENTKVLGNRWVYTLKRDENNRAVRFKARLVAQGNTQLKGESFDEVFSPVVNFSIIRLFFSMYACLWKWTHIQVDINNTYLYANLDATVYIRQPTGYEREPHKVCLLRKAIYGLHQSGRQWYLKLENMLIKLKFKKLDWCNCIYSFKDNVILLFYVDDIIVFSKEIQKVDFVLNLLQDNFDLKVLGRTKKLLGIEFGEQGNDLFIHQKSFIERVCRTYEKYKFPVSSLPISKGQVLSKLDSPKTSEELLNFPYRNLIGSLAVIVLRTRPDIMYAINVLSHFQSNPGIKHWNCLLRLLGYLKYAQNYMLELSKVKYLKLRCFSDSDFATNRDDRV
ncbi:Retrovirus-related Pol polyprotein from transposon TNT 1-94 [Araneus ventricosus]|uniref:Retrovirus-related Pol polyprotein from transposon TNT 1-94 n=1 Tax=Araneus ventricosus TaxID=182803 RepID=A0A4Y2FQQ7_ARAVE|nr:Retrovirus-related Pol polyprotein from transposon TNT 1-94 [Araneus ventricosus]